MSTEGSVLLTSPERASPNEHAQVPLYPFRFDPIYEYRPWGGRQLAKLLREPLPAEGPIGEAWALSDRPDFQSRVSDGPLKGMALHQLLEQFPDQVMGTMALPSGRFPLLLKFLDVRDLLSVQVHPSDEHADYLSEGETGKTEAWVVLRAEPESRIYAGLRPGTSREDLQRAVDDGTLADNLACFSPRAGDAMLIPAGTVHALGLGVVVFEVQQNSDITFRLYDWGHVDPRTGLPRPLQVDQAIACTDFTRGALQPEVPVPEVPVPEGTTPTVRERLVDCEQFRLWRISGRSPFTVGASGVPRALVCIAGAGAVEYEDAAYEIRRGDVMLLPAVTGVCLFRPSGPAQVLEVALPTGALKSRSGPS
jgi:mannose-6-phosphate isomerase